MGVPKLPSCRVPGSRSYQAYESVGYHYRRSMETLGTVIEFERNLPKCPVPVSRQPQTYRSVWYGDGERTELTLVLSALLIDDTPVPGSCRSSPKRRVPLSISYRALRAELTKASVSIAGAVPNLTVVSAVRKNS